MTDWESFAAEFHRRVLDVIAELIELDPPADSPEGRLLVSMSAAAENYEKARYPIDPPTPEEAAEFRKEQECPSKS